mgnify:FL=1
MKIETKCLHEGYKPGNGEPKALPIYQSTTYTYDSTEHIGQLFDLSADGHMYSRISNPTVAAVEQKIAALEGGVGALCTTSGQAASAWLTAWLSGSDTTGLVPMIQTALTSPRPMAANSSTAVSPGVCASRSVPQKRASRCRSSGTKSMCAASIVASPPTSRPPMALG